jgi:hypothetical protein
VVDLDPKTEQLARQAASWYGLELEDYLAILVRREVDRLIDESPNMASVLELR